MYVIFLNISNLYEFLCSSDENAKQKRVI